MVELEHCPAKKDKGEATSAPPKVFLACARVSYGSLELFSDYCSVNHAILMAGRTLTNLVSTKRLVGSRQPSYLTYHAL